MGVPLVYRRSKERSIASYDALDLATGTGYKRFYGIKTLANEYVLTSLTFQANDGDGSTSFTLPNPEADAGEINFDLEFKKSQTIEGELYLGASIEVNVSGGGTSATGKLKMRIIHVDLNNNETTIGTQQTSDDEGLAAESSDSWRILASFDISKTTFRVGEKLRVEVIIRGIETGTGSATSGVYHDSSGDTVTAGSNTPANSSQFIVDVPFKIDL